MIFKSVHSISIIGSVTFCSLDIIFLYQKAVVLSGRLSLEICCYILAGDLEIVLPDPNSQRSLLLYVDLFRSNIASALMRISLSMALLTPPCPLSKHSGLSSMRSARYRTVVRCFLHARMFY